MSSGNKMEAYRYNLYVINGICTCFVRIEWIEVDKFRRVFYHNIHILEMDLEMQE